MLDRTIAIALRARDFIEEEIHGAPVVDDNGIVRGVISSLDLLRIVRDEHDATTTYFRDAGPGWSPIPEDLQARMDGVTAADAMTREIVAVSPNAPIADVARRMRDQHIHRVLVIEDGELIGVITSFDLLRAFIRDERKPDGARRIIYREPSA